MSTTAISHSHVRSINTNPLTGAHAAPTKRFSSRRLATAMPIWVLTALASPGGIAAGLTGAALYTDATLTQPGLVGSYVNATLREVEVASDWRATQAISGARVDPAIEFTTGSWGSRAPLGLTGGSDTNWEAFSVQWDGFLRVTVAGQRFGMAADDGSRMWIDTDRDGAFEQGELFSNGWGAEHGLTGGERSPALAAGSYAIRIQYYEVGGDNECHLASSPFVPRQFQATAGNPRQTVRAVVLNYDPRVPSEGGRRLHEVFGWSDPHAMVKEFERDLEFATGGAIDIEVVEFRDLDDFPEQVDGYRPMPDEWVRKWRTGGPWHGQRTNFAKLVEKQGLVAMVNSGVVDEIWCFGPPAEVDLFGETWMAGPNAFYINGSTFPEIPFDRAIAGYGFNYERAVGEMLHNLGHRTEDSMARPYGGWNLDTPTTPWDRYAANNLEAPPPFGVGTAHVPTNADGHYDYADPRTVASTALDWANFPALTGATSPISSEAWFFGPAPDSQRDYFNWFWGMMPRNPGTNSDGRQANWFKYLWDFNSYSPGNGLFRQREAVLSGSRYLSGGNHLFTVRYYDERGVNTGTLDSSDIRAVGPGGYNRPATLSQIVNSNDPRRVTALYSIPAPTGTWQDANQGDYQIILGAGQVKDQTGVGFPDGSLGTLQLLRFETRAIDVLGLVSAGRAMLTNTPADIGTVKALFDQDLGSLYRTSSGNPNHVQIAFTEPQQFCGFRFYGAGSDTPPAFRIRIETADNESDLNVQAGTYRQIYAAATANNRIVTMLVPPAPVAAKIIRMTTTLVEGDGVLHLYDWTLLGPDTGDQTAPAASLTEAPDVAEAGGSGNFLAVSHTDAGLIEVGSLGTGDVIVTGPGGYEQIAVCSEIDDWHDGPARSIVYWCPAPGGAWDSTDNGTYTVALPPGEVRDISGNAAPALTLGTFSVNVPPPVRHPGSDLTENNASLWLAGAEGGTAATFNDSTRTQLGAGSIRFETNGGFDTWLRYPPTHHADWDLTAATTLHFSVFAENSNSPQFQNGSPWIRLTDVNGGWFEYRFYQGGAPADPLNSALNQWRTFTVPLNAAGNVNDGWRRTVSGSPGLGHIASIEFHADTWGGGFRLWYDAVGFDLPMDAWDNDLSVSWIERLPRLPFVWNSTNPTRDGWPAEGSTVTWGAVVKNWSPVARDGVRYRWLLNGNTLSTGTVNLAAKAWTTVELPRAWSFNREELRFEIDSNSAVAEFSETNNALSIFTDSISLGLWVEQSVYDYFHQNQRFLGDGANGWEDWAQRQVGRWNAMFAAAIDPIDAPQGVRDRIRLDKITVVADGALPLAGGLATNNPDLNDRSVDLMWGFPATQLNSTFYANHTDRADWNPFYYEGSLIHELGHARYLIDTYGFNVVDTAANPRVLVKQAGQNIAGTPFLPRSHPWSDHVYIMLPGTGNPFDGLMAGDYTRVDRYTAAAANLIAGRRAVRGNYNAPGNIGAFINDLPAANQIQLIDGNGRPLAGATVSIYRATGHPEWYGKQFDAVADLVLTADSAGRVQVGRNPFSSGDLQHTYGISNMVALVKAEAGGRTGFAFIEAGLFNMEYWRGHTAQGRYALTIPMIGTAREIVSMTSWPENGGRRVRIIVGGGQQPQSLRVGGVAAFYHEGAWLASLPGSAGQRYLTATWSDGSSIQQTVNITPSPALPVVELQPVAENPNALRLSWPTLNGHAYELQRSSDLSEWSPVTNATSFGTGDTTTRTESKSGMSSFFRLVVRRLGN